MSVTTCRYENVVKIAVFATSVLWAKNLHDSFSTACNVMYLAGINMRPP